MMGKGQGSTSLKKQGHTTRRIENITGKVQKLKVSLKTGPEILFGSTLKSFFHDSSKTFASNGRRMMGNQFRNILWV